MITLTKVKREYEKIDNRYMVTVCAFLTKSNQVINIIVENFDCIERFLREGKFQHLQFKDFSFIARFVFKNNKSIINTKGCIYILKKNIENGKICENQCNNTNGWKLCKIIKNIKKYEQKVKNNNDVKIYKNEEKIEEFIKYENKYEKYKKTWKTLSPEKLFGILKIMIIKNDHINAIHCISSESVESIKKLIKTKNIKSMDDVYKIRGIGIKKRKELLKVFIIINII